MDILITVHVDFFC